MTMRVLIFSLLFLACLPGCAGQVRHDVYRPDAQLAVVIPREVAKTQLAEYYAVSDEGIGMIGGSKVTVFYSAERRSLDGTWRPST